MHEIVDQFLKDIHGEDGREVLLIFYDYLEERGIELRRRKRIRNSHLSSVLGREFRGCGPYFGSGLSYGYTLPLSLVGIGCGLLGYYDNYDEKSGRGNGNCYGYLKNGVGSGDGFRRD